jgi:L-ascorbate metabolism protein UlaG (beta-lactamase superfamily)
MDINWYGFSCFRLRGRDVAVVTDPYDSSAGYGNLKAQAAVVTVSGSDPRHSNAKAVSDVRKVLAGPGEYEIAGLMITGVSTARPQEGEMTAPKNTAYLITMDEVTICHLGQLANTLAREQIELLKDADVLLLPVGGHGALNASQAAEVVSQLEPHLIVPMRFAVDGSPPDLDGVEAFCREMGLESPTVQPRISVTASQALGETYPQSRRFAPAIREANFPLRHDAHVGRDLHGHRCTERLAIDLEAGPAPPADLDLALRDSTTLTEHLDPHGAGCITWVEDDHRLLTTNTLGERPGRSKIGRTYHGRHSVGLRPGANELGALSDNRLIRIQHEGEAHVRQLIVQVDR